MSTPPPFSKPIELAPVHFALLLFPSFQVLDVFGPLDALNTIKRQYPSFPLRLSILSSSLDPVSCYPASAQGPHPIPFEQRIIPTHTFDSPPTDPIDVIFIPGGLGMRLPEIAGWGPLVEYLNSFFANDAVVRQLKAVFTVCTGSILFARARIAGGKGVIDGVSATTNKRAFALALEEQPYVPWERHARWVRTDLPIPSSSGAGNHTVKLWTTSGVSAGTDGIFALISEEYGPEVADFISAVLEYSRITDPNNDPFAI